MDINILILSWEEIEGIDSPTCKMEDTKGEKRKKGFSRSKVIGV